MKVGNVSRRLRDKSIFSKARHDLKKSGDIRPMLLSARLISLMLRKLYDLSGISLMLLPRNKSLFIRGNEIPIQSGKVRSLLLLISSLSNDNVSLVRVLSR